MMMTPVMPPAGITTSFAAQVFHPRRIFTPPPGMAACVLAPRTPAASTSSLLMAPYVPSPIRLTPSPFVTWGVRRTDRRLTWKISKQDIAMRHIVVLGLALVVLGCGKKEPLHKGKPAS